MSVVRARGAMVYVRSAAPDTPQVLAEIEELLQALGALRQPLRVWHVAERKLVDIAVTGLRMRASPSRSPHVQGRPAQG